VLPRSSHLPALVLLSVGTAACEPKATDSIEPSHENVQALVDRSCTFTESCHGGDGDGQAKLNFAAVTRFSAAFETDDGEPRLSCEYNRMPLVDPGKPERSWIMVKLAGPVDGIDRIIAGDWGPEAGWTEGTDEDCPDLGQRMPQVGESLSKAEISLVREWIREGAQGPSSDDDDDADSETDAGR
jgi:hypothetical protein